MNKVILTDSCFWIGLVDPTDQFHNSSKTIASRLEGNRILFPWPCLYETISTRLARRRNHLLFFEEIISKPNITLLSDNNYRSGALLNVFSLNKSHGYTYSLTDGVIREILQDIKIKINYLLTFNSRDFKDLCDQRLVEIISQ